MVCGRGSDQEIIKIDGEKDEMNKMIIDWDHVYLVGYYDKSGNPILTTWISTKPRIDVVVTGCDEVPLWRAPIPTGCKIHEIPAGRDPGEYAKSIGGLYAFGWYEKDEITRK